MYFPTNLRCWIQPAHLSDPSHPQELCVLSSFEEEEGQRRSGRGMERRIKRWVGGRKGMINPIKPLSVSSIAIVLLWLLFPQLAVGCS